jgi:hypothetical protein
MTRPFASTMVTNNMRARCLRNLPAPCLHLDVLPPLVETLATIRQSQNTTQILIVWAKLRQIWIEWIQGKSQNEVGSGQ